MTHDEVYGKEGDGGGKVVTPLTQIKICTSCYKSKITILSKTVTS